MRFVHLSVCVGSVLVLSVAAQADLILVTGTVTSWQTDDPALAGPRPATFSATGLFTPALASTSQAILFGDTDWTITLDSGPVLTNGTVPPLERPTFSQGLVESLGPTGSILGPPDPIRSVGYLLFNHRTSSAPATYDTNLQVFTGTSFPIFAGDPVRPTYFLSLLDDLRSSVAAGSIRSGTFTFTADVALLSTSLTGTVTSLQVIPAAVPEPGTRAAAVVGVAVLLTWRRLRDKAA